MPSVNAHHCDASMCVPQQPFEDIGIVIDYWWPKWARGLATFNFNLEEDDDEENDEDEHNDDEEVIRRLLQHHANLPFHRACSPALLSMVKGLHVRTARIQNGKSWIQNVKMGKSSYYSARLWRNDFCHYLLRSDVALIEDSNFSSLMVMVVVWMDGCMPWSFDAPDKYCTLSMTGAGEIVKISYFQFRYNINIISLFTTKYEYFALPLGFVEDWLIQAEGMGAFTCCM